MKKFLFIVAGVLFTYFLLKAKKKEAPVIEALFI